MSTIILLWNVVILGFLTVQLYYSISKPMIRIMISPAYCKSVEEVTVFIVLIAVQVLK